MHRNLVSGRPRVAKKVGTVPVYINSPPHPPTKGLGYQLSVPFLKPPILNNIFFGTD